MNVHELAISSRPHFRNAGPCSTGHDPEHARNDPRCEHWRQQGPARPSIEFASPQRRPPEPCSLGSGSSNASSNTDIPDRTDADPLEQNRADHPTGRTISNGLNTDRARLLIRGFGVRVPGGAPVLTWANTYCVAEPSGRLVAVLVAVGPLG